MKISVCIPTYNQADYVCQSIKSVMGQTLMPDEIIVSNDCSTDGSKELLEQLAGQLDLLTVFNQPINLGISKNTDFCLRAAQGDYVVRLDSDDLLHKNYIQTLSELLDQNPQAGFAHAAVQEINGKGEKIRNRKLNRKTGFQDDSAALKAALKGYRIAANILIFRRKALEKANYINCSEDFAEDYYLSVNIAKAGFGNVYSDEVLSSYRIWNDNGKVRQKRKLAEINGLNAVMNFALLPAFNQRKWNVKTIEQSKEHFAINHSDCLSWDVYSIEEKAELERAIYNLSSTKRVKFLVWIRKNGFGKIFDIFQEFQTTVKQRAKNMIISNNH